MQTEQNGVQNFKNAFPKCVDDVFTRNRDKAKHSLATEEQIEALSRIIPMPEPAYLTGAISDWRIVAYEITIPGEECVYLYPLGNNASQGVGCKITSPIVAIDLASYLLVTHSGSIYRLLGPQGKGEPTLHQLLHLCAAQWNWGRGRIFGVLEVFY